MRPVALVLAFTIAACGGGSPACDDASRAGDAGVGLGNAAAIACSYFAEGTCTGEAFDVSCGSCPTSYQCLLVPGAPASAPCVCSRACTSNVGCPEGACEQGVCLVRCGVPGCRPGEECRPGSAGATLCFPLACDPSR